MPKILLINLFFAISLLLISQLAFGEVLSERIANYEISVSLDPVKKQLNGQEKLTWKNTSNVEMSELHFHLYLNAFKNNKSTFNKESGGKLRGDKMSKQGIGDIYITEAKTSRGEDIYTTLEYIQPDDQNKDDQTVARFKLSKPLLPGQTIEVLLGFRAKLPKVFARTGWANPDFFMVGQWFPKIGVFEKNSKGEWAWNCHQYHAHSEFYADFGVYHVNITLPRSFVVGASGQKVGEINLKNDLKTISFLAEDVHDFAWTASPHHKVFETTWKHVKIRALMQPEHAAQYKRYFEAAIGSLEYMDEHVGKYPYPTLTLVDPPIDGQGAAGMEYPTIITCGTFWGLGKWQKTAEIVTVHEFGHQYFQGMLASNEFEQSFLDEGFTQYIEGKIMKAIYGEKGSLFNFFDFYINDEDNSRSDYVNMKFPEISQINVKSWEYPKGTYATMTYTKTATVLQTFENLIGSQAMEKIFRAYFKQYKFKHPRLADFVKVVNASTGKDYYWYFDQAFQKNWSCDYLVYKIVNDQEVLVKRKGKFVFPQEILITYQNGNTELRKWDGKNDEYKVRCAQPIKSVQLDPSFKNRMDLNFVNNQLSVDPPSTFLAKYSLKSVFWFQNMFSMLWLWLA